MTAGRGEGGPISSSLAVRAKDAACRLRGSERCRAGGAGGEPWALGPQACGGKLRVGLGKRGGRKSPKPNQGCGACAAAGGLAQIDEAGDGRHVGDRHLADQKRRLADFVAGGRAGEQGAEGTESRLPAGATVRLSTSVRPAATGPRTAAIIPARRRCRTGGWPFDPALDAGAEFGDEGIDPLGAAVQAADGDGIPAQQEDPALVSVHDDGDQGFVRAEQGLGVVRGDGVLDEAGEARGGGLQGLAGFGQLVAGSADLGVQGGECGGIGVLVGGEIGAFAVEGVEPVGGGLTQPDGLADMRIAGALFQADGGERDLLAGDRALGRVATG